MALSGVAHGNNRVMSKLGGELARLAGLAGFPSHGAHRQRLCKLLTLAAVQSQAPVFPSDAYSSSSWQQPVHGATALPSARHTEKRQGSESGHDKNADSLQGRQRRRRGLQGLTGTGLARPDITPAQTSSESVSANGKASQRAKLVIASPLLPPHLAAAASATQQDSSSDVPHCVAQHLNGEAALDATSLGQQPALQDKGNVLGTDSTDLERQLSNGQASSSNAAELAELGDRAEGVLQFGSSGARIPLYGRSIEGILQAVTSDRQRLAGGAYSGVAPDEAGDDALDVTFDQLPPRWHARSNDFDWSGRTNYTAAHRKVQDQRVRWDAARALGSTEKVALTVEGEPVLALPLWVAVHQDSEGGLARLHESTFAMTEALFGRLEASLVPFCAVAGLRFEEGADERAGPWRSYFVGVIGDVDAEEADVLWPNQVIHGARTMYNVRNGWDIARFLGDPLREDVEDHLANLQRLQDERQYKPGWCYRMLRLRWGQDVLRRFDLRARLE